MTDLLHTAQFKRPNKLMLYSATFVNFRAYVVSSVDITSFITRLFLTTRPAVL